METNSHNFSQHFYFFFFSPWNSAPSLPFRASTLPSTGTHDIQSRNNFGTALSTFLVDKSSKIAWKRRILGTKVNIHSVTRCGSFLGWSLEQRDLKDKTLRSDFQNVMILAWILVFLNTFKFAWIFDTCWVKKICTELKKGKWVVSINSCFEDKVHHFEIEIF